MSYEKSGGLSLAYGLTIVLSLLTLAPKRARRIYLHPKLEDGEGKRKILELARKESIPLILNNEKIFKGSKEATFAAAEFEKEFVDLDPKANHLVLDSPSNMGNLGTIFRAAAALGIEDVALLGNCADPYDPKTVRASMGGIFLLRINRYKDYEEYINKVGERNVYPFMLQAEDYLEDALVKEPYSLLFGNEGRGLDRSFLNVGTPLKIRQNDLVDSLNLDNAVSIALYAFSLKTNGDLRK